MPVNCARFVPGWRVAPLLGAALAGTALPAHAQQWNRPDVVALIHRGVERRQIMQGDSTLRSYRTRAHGFVFFLAQLGSGLNQPPRLVKADELDVEVYWQAPDRSKQVILGWRDGSWLPTDINYHRDHLGIVTNNFGNRIRIGEGDEVRDVVHPLSPEGLERYDFALSDSVSITVGSRTVRVYAVRVRPRDFSQPLVVGVLYLDVATAELVRFRFSFTPVAYLDRQLEDISVILENSLWEGRYWLPYRQEIEIRRRTTWLDFPARGIIRGRWEIGSYDFNLPLPPTLFQGPAIAGLRAPRNQDSVWTEPLDAAVEGVAAPLNRQDMEGLRVEVERVAGTRALSGLASTRLAAGSISDIARVNRVQGLALGFGAVIGLGQSRFQIRPYAAYGTSDHRLLGSLAISLDAGPTRLFGEAARRIRDLSDVAVISPVFNSITSQEFGQDHGDYLLLESGTLGIRHRLSARTTLGLEGFVERSASVGVTASPATGSYRPNPALGAGDYAGARLRLERGSGGTIVRRDLQGRLNLEAGSGPVGYARAWGEAQWTAALGHTELAAGVRAGWGSDGLPAYRSFVMGGRGTLPGEPFRAYGGRSAVLGHLEWRFDAPFPAIPLGSFANTGRTVTLAPFVAAGWADRALSDQPWRATEGIRPVAGVALEWFMRLVRIELGVGLRGGDVGLSVDVNRAWWGIL